MAGQLRKQEQGRKGSGYIFRNGVIREIYPATLAGQRPHVIIWL